MLGLYSNGFTIVVPEEKKPEETFVEVFRDVRNWVIESWERQTGRELVWDEAQKAVVEEDARVQVKPRWATGANLLEVLYEHTDSEADTRRWRTDVTLAQFSSAISFEIRVSCGYGTRTLKPLDVTSGPPKIVEQLVKKYSCVAGGERVDQRFMAIKSQNVESFVNDELLSPSRSVPIVVLTAPLDRRSPLVSPKLLARRLAGLARVASIVDKPVVRKFIELMPPGLAVLPDAVRFYYPGLRPDSAGEKHPLYRRANLESWGIHGPYGMRTFIEKEMFELASKVLAKSSIVELARDHISRQLVEQARNGGAEELANLIEANEMLESQVEGLKCHINELEEQVNSLQKMLAIAPSRSAVGSDVEPPLEVMFHQSPTIGRGVESIVARLEGLEFGPRATEDKRHLAQDGNGRLAKELASGLAALREMSLQHRAGEGRLGCTVEEWWTKHQEERGERLPKITLHESETTRTQYGSHRKFLVNGTRHQFECHLTLCEGDSELCTQIYWRFAENFGIQIGYVGEHLPYATGA